MSLQPTIVAAWKFRVSFKERGAESLVESMNEL